jgi:hypothetical protein
MKGGDTNTKHSTEKTKHIQGEDTEILKMFSPQDQPS